MTSTIVQPPQVQGNSTGETAAGDPSDATPTRSVTIGNYTYTVTPADPQREQQAFEAGEGVCN